MTMTRARCRNGGPNAPRATHIDPRLYLGGRLAALSTTELIEVKLEIPLLRCGLREHYQFMIRLNLFMARKTSDANFDFPTDAVRRPRHLLGNKGPIHVGELIVFLFLVHPPKLTFNFLTKPSRRRYTEDDWRLRQYFDVHVGVFCRLRIHWLRLHRH